MFVINGPIGYDEENGGTLAKPFIDQLKEQSGDIEIAINSNGGIVSEGVEIYNALMAYEGKVTVRINVMAASIASVIAMAADHVIIDSNAQMMIHKAWTVAAGNSDELKQVAVILDQLDGGIADVYAERTGIDKEELLALMGKEFYMTAAEAVKLGFADEINVIKRDRSKNTEATPEASQGNLSWATALARASVIVRNTKEV